MGTRKSRGEIDDATLKIIRIKAWLLASSPGFLPDDQDDIQQDLILDLLQRLPKFDPRRGSRTSFINRILDHKVANLVEHCRAGMRDPRVVAFSLNEEVEMREGDRIERGELVGEPTLDLSVRHAQRDHELRVVLARAICRLAPGEDSLRARRRRWAELLRRIWDVDVETCPRCGGPMTILAFTLDPDVIDETLRRLRQRGHDPRAGPWASDPVPVNHE